MKLYICLARTLFLIGINNVIRVVIYRISLRLPFSKIRRLYSSPLTVGPFFSKSTLPLSELDVETTKVSPLLFSRLAISPSPLPDWFKNPINGQVFPGEDRDWWRISDFDPAVGDIKLVWELSRFDWVLKFARLHKEGDLNSLFSLDAWINSWCEKNPPYKGPNWKCGQEASIRVLNLFTAAIVVKQAKSSNSNLLKLVKQHLLRISPTVSYAVAQDNNHGTSEAAALFIGGGWLLWHGDSEGRYWHEQGRRCLEERVERLIDDDGGFSQYSVNYHRLMLDTLSIVELAVREFSFSRLSDLWYKKAKLAAYWLWRIADDSNGDAPNIGANDGARLLQLTDTDYRDFRPSVQLGVVLFSGQSAYEGEGPWLSLFELLGISLPTKVLEYEKVWMARRWGLSVVRNEQIMVALRFPRFRFRPSHADALHLDCWVRGRNVLRDGGTYSYNTDKTLLSYFSGVESHNTVQFDGRDQMPRLSRFLFGDWLRSCRIDDVEERDGSFFMGAAYQDSEGAFHSRKVQINSLVRVVDELHGFKTKAVLRWRLAPGDWIFNGQSVVSKDYVLAINASVPILRMELVDGFESRFYLEKKTLPVLEVEIREPGTVSTEFQYK